MEFASVNRRVLLVAGVGFYDEADEDLASSGSTSNSLCPEDRAEKFGETLTLVGGSGASVEATRPEVAGLGQLVQGLGRLQSA